MGSVVAGRPLNTAAYNPALFTHARAHCRPEDANVCEGDYEWVREYAYDVKHDTQRQQFDLGTRLVVQKRGKRLKNASAATQQAAEFPRPEKVGGICAGPAAMICLWLVLLCNCD